MELCPGLRVGRREQTFEETTAFGGNYLNSITQNLCRPRSQQPRRSHQLPTHPLLLLPTRLSSAAAMPSTASRSLGGSASSLGRSSATVTSPRSTDRRRAAHCPALQKATCHTHFAASCRTSPPPHVGVRARHGGSCAASSASFFIWHPIAAHARLRGVAHATYLCKSP